MRRFLEAAAMVLAAALSWPVVLWATGNLTIPNTIFTQPNPVSTNLLDQNWAAIASYVNARQVTVDVFANRPVAGVAGRYYLASDQNGGTYYLDTGSAWTQVAPSVSGLTVNQRASLTIANGFGSTSQITVFPGAATSDDIISGTPSRVLITLISSQTKNILNPFKSAGVDFNTGCLDTGSAAAFTWYHVFLITRLDSGLVDVLCSTSATNPTMPANYTKKIRLGSFLTTWFPTPGAEIFPFTQTRNRFTWATGIQDVNSATPGTNANIATISVPNGVIVRALTEISVANTGNAYLSALFQGDQSVGSIASCGATGGGTLTCQAQVITDPSQRIRFRLNANVAFGLIVRSWEELWD